MLTENQQRNFMSTCNQRDRKWESKAHVKHSFLRKLTIGATHCSFQGKVLAEL